ncbi:MAG: AAA family ATPase [Clostridia bacterium]|nr:AAA family ATPase [Clostridia bacterium]
MKRKIYDELLKWKEEKDALPLMVLGVRQCGKTHIINEFIENEFKNHITINLLQNTDILTLYKSSKSSLDKYKELKAFINCDLEQDDTILFIDEIQESEELISELKFFAEHLKKARIICAGSLLGVKLKREVKNFPVGKVKTLNMYPMSFDEYLMAIGKNDLIDLIRNSYDNDLPLSEGLHNMCLNHYKEYLVLGGMPMSIKEFIDNDMDYIKIDSSILSNLKNDYIDDFKKYVTNNSEILKITKVFNSMPSQLGNSANKFQYSKIENGARKKEYELAIEWLLAANIGIRVTKVTNGLKPLKGYEDCDYFKLYMSDIGILNNMLDISIVDYLKDDLSLYKGVITENYVLNELVKNNFIPYYWENDSKAEIDFIINYKNEVVPIEVKAGNNTMSKSLDIYMKKYDSKFAIRISSKNFGYNEISKIKSVPLYAVFCINN